MNQPDPAAENWDARKSPAWVACPTCGERVEMPIDFPPPETPDERFRFVDRIVTPFVRRLRDECHYAEKMRHA